MSERTERYTTNATLLPCPWCGVQPDVTYCGDMIDISCNYPCCPINPAYSNNKGYAQAATDWNTRAAPPQPAASAWDTWDGQTLIEPEPTSALTPATALQHRRKLLAVIVQGLIERGVITAEDVASVGGVR